MTERSRRWDAGRPVDVVTTLGPLRHGVDPTFAADPDSTVWRAVRTPEGPGTLAVRGTGSGADAQAWGAGAGWLLDRLPTLLGVSDDWSGLDLSAVPALELVRRGRPGLRLCRTELVLDSLVPAVLEQKVTGGEAWRAWRTLVRRFGEPAPGPRAGLWVGPAAEVLRAVPSWDWHRAGVEARRQRTVQSACAVAARLEECVALSHEAARARLRVVPGVGEWTAAETTLRALGDPDAVSVGDYHLADLVVHALTGRARGTDAEMLDLLAPWAGQRARVVRLIELSGVRPPKFGPRFAPTDIRAL